MTGEVTYSFNVPDVSATTFWIVVSVLLLATIFLAIYDGFFVFYLGKSMRKYLTARLASGKGILQVFEHENLFLHIASLLNGGVFIDEENAGVKPVIPKSIVTLNAVSTTLVWNLTPKLPDVYKAALEKLVSLGYNSVDDILEDLNSIKYHEPDDLLLEKNSILKTVSGLKKKRRELILFTLIEISIIVGMYAIGLGFWYIIAILVLSTSIAALILLLRSPKKSETIVTKTGDKYNLTYAEFLSIHERVRARNTIEVTTEDVIMFNEKFLDEHAKASLVERRINVEKKKLREKKYQKWAFIIIAVLVIGGLALKAYMVLHGGK
ncbi:MAG: hypothetical protein OIN84_20610 [Candidatus Methanoperedens sp.]|nr:hypothetical protein [Candidatus Methanoperedens sp. BLZ2]KAB2942408.1 MAG: hypothetical protein F9K14_17310 [Candidatus Methanoperedens sp.]MBZ0176651.1 hypothetical protein [Candidatus Methanoperedens nitroreducens]MCX9080375.1 hypothetical protein [Candidatus Methanoperedens sp.]